MSGSPPMQAAAGAGSAADAPHGLAEAARLPWRAATTERTLRRVEVRWTVWTSWVVILFTTPGMLLLWIEPLTLPAALICFVHAWAVPRLQARRGALSVVPMGSERSAVGRRAADAGADAVALGLLGDLVGHRERELVAATGLVLERGSLGIWLIGEQGAILVRPGGRRADCWCVRVSEQADLPAADRVAHLLLALREDERGFAKVANFGFSGAALRVRRHLPAPARPALDAAREFAREG
jgi:hypothetical protein